MSDDAARILADARALLSDRFEPKRMLGRGGMAVVILARHVALGRDVAIKLLPASFHDDPVARQRFIREARACARLTHQNIVTVHDVDENAGYIVMEHVEGQSLAARLASRKTLSVGEVTALGRAMLNALHIAHDAGIVHRDIKPSNILFDGSDTPKLADFGVAHVGEASLTQTGNFVGTPAYMAPEQLRGREVDGRADVYALGATLFEAATGRQLHAKHASIEDAHAAVLTATDSRALAAVIDKAVAEAPEDRFADVAEFDAALADVERGWDPSTPSSRPDKGIRIRDRRRSSMSFVIALLVGLVGSAAAVVTIRRLDPIDTTPVRIALLPFEEKGDRDDLAFVSGGLPEVLHGELSASKRLEPVRYQAISRELPNASPTDGDWLEAARVLGAGVALSGSVSSKSGDVLRVELRLVAMDGTVLERWSDEVADADALTSYVRQTAIDVGRTAYGHGRSGDLVYQQHLGRGVEALGEHDLSPAIQHLTAAVEADPTRADAHYYLAIAQWWSERPVEELRAKIVRARAAGVSADRASFLDGLELLIAERYTEAITFFERFHAERPTNRAATYGLYEALFHGGRTRDAIAIYRELAARFPRFQLGALHALTYGATHGDAELLNWALAHIEGTGHYVDWPGRRWVALRDYERAIEVLTRASEATNPRAHLAQQALLETLFLAGHDDVVAARLAKMRETNDAWSSAEHALALLRGDPVAIAEARARAIATAEERLVAARRLGFTGLVEILFAELQSADASTLKDLEGRLTAIADARESRDPRFEIVRTFAAIGRQDRGTLARNASAPHLELQSIARGGLALIDKHPADAVEHFRAATEASGDGWYVIGSWFYMARAYAMLDDDSNVVRACDEVIRSRLFRWGWAGWVGPCLALTAVAQRGDPIERGETIARLGRLRRDAPANDPVMTTARGR